MKRIWILLFALLLTVGLAACDQNEPVNDTTVETPTEAPTETPTEAPTEEPTETPTEEPTEAPTDEDVTLPPETEAPTDEEVWTEPEDAPYEVVDIPIVSGVKGKTPHGYNISGEFSFEYGDAVSTTENNMFVVTNDRLYKGKITATFTAPDQYINDNGIIFGMKEDEYQQYYFWEDGPTYYFLFVSDDATLYLAKVSDNGNPWTELHITAPIPNYKHGDTVTISVEFDGEGFIDCYVNEEWLISYYDEAWTGGGLYGIRCEVPEVCYTDVVVDHDWVPEW